MFNSNQFVPRAHPGFYKPWWNDTLADLKKASIAAHNLWKASSCPRSGEVFLQMKSAKSAYKNAIKAQRVEDDSYFSNDLHELLLEKDMVQFWKSWSSKMVKDKPAVVIDKESDGRIIAQKFADHFRKSCTLVDMDHPHNSEELLNLAAYISCAKADDFSLLDVETVNTCLAQMAKGKAPGVDGIQVEHLIYAHPIVIVLLCVLFNIMLTHGIVPTLFSSGIIVPILKDKHGDSSDMNNYRAITLSLCISKLFEKCLLSKFGHLLAVSPLQYGFQKKLSCSHAIYMLRAVTDYYVTGLSTVITGCAVAPALC